VNGIHELCVRCSQAKSMRDDLVGINEIAELARVSRQAVANWRARWPDFPEPVLVLASGPIFLRSQVIAWMAWKRKPMTDHCPVCLTPAEAGGYGDRKQVHCPRCGPFEISGTALAILGSRVGQDPLARARLSHAIRSKTSEHNWLFVSSANLDELAQQPLPGIHQQLQHLASWLAAQLGDDALGRVRCPWPDSLAGMIGAADGERVERLIAYAVKEGIVVREDEKDLLGLSPEGWRMIESPKKDATSPQAAPVESSSEIIKSHCNVCGGERNGYKRASYTVNGEEEGEDLWSDTYDVVECCGCNILSVRRTFWCSAGDSLVNDSITGQPRFVPGIEVTYWPPPTKRKRPEWADKLDDEPLRKVVDEVYRALNAGMIVLASIGTRTLLDRAMYLRIGDPKGGFAGKLDLMVEKGHIGKNERDTLKATTDAGSAAAHQGFSPSAKTLATIVDTVENFLHREFVLKTAAGEVRTAVPARPK
jgi:hypothetical protein